MLSNFYAVRRWQQRKRSSVVESGKKTIWSKLIGETKRNRVNAVCRIWRKKFHSYLLLYFCLRPSAKDQGITWAVVVVVLVLAHHLVHFLLKINLSEFLPSWESNRGPLAPQPCTLSTELLHYWYKLFEIFFNVRNSKTTRHTSRQSWCNYLLSYRWLWQRHSTEVVLEHLTQKPRVRIS